MSKIDTLGLPRFEEIEAALASDAPHRWGLETSRKFSLLAEPAQGALWLLAPAGDQPIPVPPATSVVTASVRKVGEEFHVQVGSNSHGHLREVYYFLCGVVHRAEHSSETLPEVIHSELLAWEALLRVPSRIDRNKEIGLLGELWILWRILQNLGSTAIDSWTGPSSEQHDFRLETDDLEVKTTLSHGRDHLISGLGQLSTVQHRRLFVISIQVKPAGGGPGATLPDAVTRIAESLYSDVSALKKFDDKLGSLGYRHADGSNYSDRYCLRSSPTLVRVDSAFPRLTTEALTDILSASSLQRIRKVLYTANLDGMGTTLDANLAVAVLRRPDSGDIYA